MIHRILVLGAGSAGLIAALTLKRRIPELEVTVLRSPEIGVIGVGEGTTPELSRHLFQYVGLDAEGFLAQTEPMWKLGTRFLWGPRREFYHPYAPEFGDRTPEASRSHGYFYTGEPAWAGPISAFMAHDRAFSQRSDGMPEFHDHHGYHIENKRLVGWLENQARLSEVRILDATILAERDHRGITALVSSDGERYTADLFVDASGFRSELLGAALAEPFLDYQSSLLCDRAVFGGWARSTEPIKPYTTIETMTAGWCWQIEHEHWINRGYVYASAFVDDDTALREFLAVNPRISTLPRQIRFRSGRYRRNWAGNVVALGNASGFVEPLQATALQMICTQSRALADALRESDRSPTPEWAERFNRGCSLAWDEVRDFLGVHYAFNTRRRTPFWDACRNGLPLHDAGFLVSFYRENGPSLMAAPHLLRPSNPFGLDGYLALLLGQAVPHSGPRTISPEERRYWESACTAWALQAIRGLTVRQCLDAVRRGPAR